MSQQGPSLGDPSGHDGLLVIIVTGLVAMLTRGWFWLLRRKNGHAPDHRLERENEKLREKLEDLEERQRASLEHRVLALEEKISAMESKLNHFEGMLLLRKPPIKP
jgi:hypothetical protein